MEKEINSGSNVEIVESIPMEKKTMIVAAVAVAALVVIGTLAVIFLNKEEARKEVLFVNMGTNLMESWLEINQSDAYISWEPFVSSSVVNGNGRVLMWSGEIMPHHPCCVVVVSKAFLAQPNGTEMVQRLVKAHIEATEWMLEALSDKNSTNYTTLVNIAVEFTNRSAAVVNESLKHLEYGYQMNASFKSALEQFTTTYINDGWITNDTFHNRGYTSPTDFVNKYVNGSFVDAAGTVAPSATMFPTVIRLGFLTQDIHQLAQAVALNATSFGGQSLFQKYGLNVTKALANGYGAGGDVMTAMGLGQVDIGYLGAPPAILKHINNNVDAVIVAQANMEGSGIVVSVHSNINTIEDLAGRIIATPSVTSIQHLLLKMELNRLGIELVKG